MPETTTPTNAENHEKLSLAELQERLRPFCEKHHIRRLDIFGSTARGQARPGSDVDLLVTFDDSPPIAELMEMAGEAEEIIGAPVDFVLRRHLETSPNRFARDPPPFASMDAEQLGRLRDILEAARLIASYLSGTSETSFHADRQKQDAVIRRIEIIGEAVAHLWP
jgi:uncharacterized protein